MSEIRAVKGRRGRRYVKIEFYKGNTAFVKITPMLDGAEYILSDSDEMRFTVKKKLSERILLQKSFTKDSGNIIIFTPEDTGHIPPGTYRYDCGIYAQGGFFTFIERDDFVIKEIVTEPFGRENDNPVNLEITGEIEIPKVVNGVISVNGKSGIVSLSPSDIGLSAMSAKEITDIFYSKIKEQM
ncbi:MAG: hypothetical protein LBL98_03835 [Ruminococcus sp.]|nr:hypothetical protein [Ruminococcus sp.]